MLTAENNRLPTATKPVAKRIAAHIRWLEKELSCIDRDLEEAIKSNPTLREALLGVTYLAARSEEAGGEVRKKGLLTRP
jgi:hypothetical protein